MRLREKDKAWLAALVKGAVADALTDVLPEIVNGAVWKALTIEMSWEKVRDEKTGVPLAAKEVIKEDVFLPSFFAQHIKFHEGAYRGSQETLDKVKNKSDKLVDQVKIMGQAFALFQDPMIVLERFVGLLAQTGIMDGLEEATAVEVEGPGMKKIASGGENAGNNR